MKRVDREKVTMESLQKLTNALSKGTIHDPIRPPLPQNWGSQPQPKTAIAIISRPRVKLRTANLADTFIGSIRSKAH